MTRECVVGRNAAGALIAITIALATAAASAAPHIANDRVLPDLDRGLPAVLDVEQDLLTTAPRPTSFQNETDFKAALARLGDFAYEDAEGGLLFVASASVAALGTQKPTAAVLQSLPQLIEKRDFLRGAELNPGSWFAARTRRGHIVLGRVVSRTRSEIRLCWAPPASSKAHYTLAWVEAIAAVGPPAISTALIPPLPISEPAPEASASSRKNASTPKAAAPPVPLAAVLNLQRGSLAVGPTMVSPFSAAKMQALTAGVRVAGDLAYFPQGSGLLVVASGKVARLGGGYMRALAGRDLERRLRDASLLTLSEIQPGSVLLVQTVKNQFALVRFEGLEPNGLRVTWTMAADHRAIFPDLAAFDATFQIPDQKELDRQLLAAAARGDHASMRRLIEMGANANAKLGRGGRNALMQAVIDGNIDSIQFLLASGADPDATGHNGWSALHAAARFGRLDLVDALIAAGADAGILTPDGKDALKVALESPRQNEALIRSLRNASDAPDSLGLVARVGDLDALTRMIDEGVDINGRNDGGMTALHIAAAAGKFNLVRALLAAGADPSLESDVAESPLSTAARAGQTEAVSALLEHGGNTEHQKASALYSANVGGDPSLARLLLRHGADAELARDGSLPAVNHAFQYGSEDLVEAYVDAGHALDVATAARLGRAEQLAEMLLEGADPYEPSPNGSAPFAEAIKNDQVEVVQVFLDHGVDPGEPLPTWDKKFPLHVAAERNNSALALMLLEGGADPNQVDTVGRSPLYEAVVSGREDTVRVLLQYGADPNVAPSGEDLLDATRSESLRKLLEDHGAISKAGPSPVTQ
jgi:ankyrin repeat protein